MKSRLVLALCLMAMLPAQAALIGDAYEEVPIAAPAAGPKVYVFEARAGESLRAVLLRWSAQAGWPQPVWKTAAASDFAVAGSLRLETTYPSAVKAFLGALPGARLSAAVDVQKKSTVVIPAK